MPLQVSCYFLEMGIKEKVGMSLSGRLQTSSSFLHSHYLQSFRLQNALYLHLKKYSFAFQYLKKMEEMEQW